MTSVVESVDLHVTRGGARALYPSTGRGSVPKVLSDYLIDRLPEPVRSMVLERIEGRRSQVEVVLEDVARRQLQRAHTQQGP